MQKTVWEKAVLHDFHYYMHQLQLFLYVLTMWNVDTSFYQILLEGRVELKLQLFHRTLCWCCGPWDLCRRLCWEPVLVGAGNPWLHQAEKEIYYTEFNKQISSNNKTLDTLRETNKRTVKYFRSHFKLLQCYSVHITVHLNPLNPYIKCTKVTIVPAKIITYYNQWKPKLLCYQYSSRYLLLCSTKEWKKIIQVWNGNLHILVNYTFKIIMK